MASAHDHGPAVLPLVRDQSGDVFLLLGLSTDAAWEMASRYQYQAIEFKETALIYKLARFSREEVQTMLQLPDIRQTRIWQEAKEEGIEEGIEKGIEKGIARAVVKLAATSMSPEKIAATLGVDMEFVRRALSGKITGRT